MTSVFLLLYLWFALIFYSNKKIPKILCFVCSSSDIFPDYRWWSLLIGMVCGAYGSSWTRNICFWIALILSTFHKICTTLLNKWMIKNFMDISHTHTHTKKKPKIQPQTMCINLRVYCSSPQGTSYILYFLISYKLPKFHGCHVSKITLYFRVMTHQSMDKNGCHFSHIVFRGIVFNVNPCILIKDQLQSANNKSALAQMQPESSH